MTVQNSRCLRHRLVLKGAQHSASPQGKHHQQKFGQSVWRKEIEEIIMDRDMTLELGLHVRNVCQEAIKVTWRKNKQQNINSDYSQSTKWKREQKWSLWRIYYYLCFAYLHSLQEQLSYQMSNYINFTRFVTGKLTFKFWFSYYPPNDHGKLLNNLV